MKTRHHVLLFTGYFTPGSRAGGPIRSVVETLDRLDSRIRVTVITRDRDLGDRKSYGTMAKGLQRYGRHRVFYHAMNSPVSWFRLLRLVASQRFDVVSLNSLWSPAFTVLPVVLRFVHVVRAEVLLLAPMGAFSPGALLTSQAKKKFAMAWWFPILERAKVVWQVSTEMEKEEVRTFFPDANTIVQLDSLGPEPVECVQPSGGAARLVYLGRIAEKKNLLFGLQALAEVRQCQLILDIYGPIEDERYWARCLAVIRTLPLSVTVEYCGEALPEDVAGIFSLYDAFLFPTKGENFGHVVVESLSAGCPVICSEHTPWTETLRNGGGHALPSLTTNELANVLKFIGGQSAHERTAGKRRALDAYIRWRETAIQDVALNRALLGVSSAGRATAPSKSVAIVTQGYGFEGGLRTVAKGLREGLIDLGWEVAVFNCATSRADKSSRLFLDPRSWFKTTLLQVDPSDEFVINVGASGVEFEPRRYLPRRELTARLEGYDVIQVVAGGAALAVCTRSTSTPVVLQVATTAAWERRQVISRSRGLSALSQRAVSLLVTRMERSAYQSVDVSLVENPTLEEHIGRFAEPARVKLLPPGVDTEIFQPSVKGWDRTGYLLCFGRLSDPRKGYDRVLQAYAKLLSRDCSVPQLLLAGRGELIRDDRQLLESLSIRDHVRVYSDVPPSDLPDLFRGASVFVQASHEEGLGLAAIEAMASGLPVIATETAGTKQTVVDGQNGWLIPQSGDVAGAIASHIFYLLGNPSVGQEMAIGAREQAVRNFSQRSFALECSTIYNGILTGKR